MALTELGREVQLPVAGPQLTTGAGEAILVARLTVAHDPLSSVRYGSRSRVGAAAAAVTGTRTD